MLDTTNATALAALPVSANAIGFAKSTMAALTDWMRGRTAIVDDYAARRAHELVDRANRSLATLEDERDSLVRPLNAEVKAINDRYREPRTGLEKARNVLKTHLTAFARREEEKRQQAAAEARRIAQEAAQAALEAKQRETEALIDEAQHGVIDTDFGALQEQTAQAVDMAARACRDL